MQIKTGSTDRSVRIRIVDSTDGTPETGVTSATSGLSLSYQRDSAAVVAIGSLSDLSALTDAHSDGGLLHIGAGYYRLDVPDAAFATGVDSVLIFGTVTGMVIIGQEVQLVGYNPRTELTSAVLAYLDVAISSRLAPTTSGRTLDVTATGAAGVDWSNVENPTTTLNLSGTTIKDVTDPVDATVSSTTVTLSQVRGLLPGITNAGDFDIRRGDTFSHQLTGLGNLSSYTKLRFTVKRNRDDVDADALIQILLTNPAGGSDGLQVLRGASATAAQGSIAVDDATAGDITLTAASAATATLSPIEDLYYDVQMTTASGDTTLAEGRCSVTADVTRAVG